MRTCTQCGEEKPVAEFHRKGPDLQPGCKPCTNTAARVRYAASAERQRAAASRRYVKNRERVRAQQATYHAENRAAHRGRMAAYHAANRAPRREQMAASYRANRPSRAAYMAAYRAANPDLVAEAGARYRALKRAATVVPFTPAQLDARMSMFGHRCWMCRGPFQHVDHVKPLSKGGPHMLANLRPACQPCNTRKRAKWEGVGALSRRPH
jgi:5-methylcytosine-specific restriction endonuclease McrA